MEENIIEALKKFYQHYDSANMPSEDELIQLATGHVGQEDVLWRDLYGHYDSRNVPEGADMLHLLSIEYPYKKKEEQELGAFPISTDPSGTTDAQAAPQNIPDGTPELPEKRHTPGPLVEKPAG